jgi:hypothetical protein
MPATTPFLLLLKTPALAPPAAAPLLLLESAPAATVGTSHSTQLNSSSSSLALQCVQASGVNG